jgi:hypothetical protein
MKNYYIFGGNPESFNKGGASNPSTYTLAQN